LLDLYEVSGSLRERLTELCRTANQRGWWDAYAATLGYGYSTFVALENDAESERFYGQGLVPGILQTSGYAEEVLRKGVLVAPPGEISRRLATRMTRQQHMLAKDEPLQMSTVLDEGALRRQVGGPDVMADQISHLIEMADRPNINLQILPFSTGAHIAMAGSFTLLHFPGPTTSDIVYVENMADELFMENEAQTFHYTLAFERLTELALGPEESVALAARIAREIKQPRQEQ
jgi:hypothetical protein